MEKSIAVIGAGSMGTAVSILLSRNGHAVKMWSPFEEEVTMLNEKREHQEKLPGAILPMNIVCTTDLAFALCDSMMIVLVVPSQTVRESCERIAALSVGEGRIVVCFSKGLEVETGLRMSEVMGSTLCGASIVAMSGPCHAEELARDLPTAYVAASEDTGAAERVQDVFMSPTFRVYTSADIVGVELGGALKNVIALCAGISDGLGFGDNTKAALMTRGIAEMQRLAHALNADAKTISGLAGIGDLIVTCTSMHSRNRRAGILIGQGKSVKEATDIVKMVVEGITTTKAAYQLATKMGVTMPIITEAYDVVFNGKDPRQAVTDLMTREKKHEYRG